MDLKPIEPIVGERGWRGGLVKTSNGVSLDNESFICYYYYLNLRLFTVMIEYINQHIHIIVQIGVMDY